MTINVKIAAAQLLSTPLTIVPVKSVERKRKIAGAILFILFGLIGCLMIAGSFKGEAMRYDIFILGVFFIGIPFLIHLIAGKAKGKMIAQLTEQGIITKNGKIFMWENLKSITFQLAMRKLGGGQIPRKCHMIDFYFTDGSARAGFLMREFMEILYIANSLNVPKKEKTNAYMQ